MKQMVKTSAAVTFSLSAAVIFFVLLFAVSLDERSGEEEAEPEEQRTIYIAAEEVPEEYLEAYQEAAEAYSIPWELLAAIHRVETIFSTMDPLVSPVGAEGHFQFMPCTWTGWGHPSCEGLGEGDIPEEEKTDPEVIEAYGGYGQDAEGNGEADPFDLHDAMHSAAYYLARNGADEGNYEQAVYQYNRAEWYVDDVLSYKEAYEEGYRLFNLEEREAEYAGSSDGIS
ncbi:lytic transglycosylase domain-containing protein [Bacillus daqingensis]|uniref:Lytic transglycosylase domain-containing protein n=1 Tax=Bacillus daqingensis TaxID=872396 RepID=A0ABV9NRS7_9BACI